MREKSRMQFLLTAYYNSIYTSSCAYGTKSISIKDNIHSHLYRKYKLYSI